MNRKIGVWKRFVLLPILAAVILATGLMPSLASAHATLVSSTPADQTSMAKMPETIQLTFNETIQGEFLSIEITNTAGKKMPVGQATVQQNDERIVTSAVEGDFPDGIYTLNWRVVSADGHPIRGTIRFGIGSDGVLTDAGVAGGAADYTPGADTVAHRAALYTLFSAVAGVILFLGFLLPAELRSTQSITRPMRILFWTSMTLLLLVILIGLPLQAKLFADVPWSEAFGKEILGQTLEGTSSGRMFLLQVLVWLMIAGAVVVNDVMGWGKRGGHWTIVIVGFVLLLVTKALTGHAAGTEHVFSQVLADTLHMLGATVWIGGILALLFYLIFAKKEGIGGIWKKTVQRFAPWAFGSVIALIFSGVVMSVTHIPTWSDLFTSRYGQLIVAKSVLLLIMATLGFIHFRNARRKQEAQKIGALITEFAAGIIVLVLAGLLTNVPTPPPAAAAPTAFSDVQPAEDAENVKISLDVRPLKVGNSTFTVRFTDAEGAARSDWQQVTLRIAPQASPTEETEVRADKQTDGSYQVSGLYFGNAGTWNVEVHGLSDRFEQADRTFTMEVNE
ncbi:copper resistance CopC/CopD family protein [Saccharibacillus sp. JS10]|uniref:copper resistance CopC/CopD family protein n=1 Tax=Saccharibacillus sp. JS10 TaxID=2950552 RepID=UPI002109B3AF|nr:copper resistance protein CopC [Saccharibacillus sp. JS10]MCQ4085301.1 copper resistance protein CopC [Saccharibacillus sp. JS10]